MGLKLTINDPQCRSATIKPHHLLSKIDFPAVGSQFALTSVALGENQTSSKLVVWRYGITNKDLYQVRETPLLEDFPQQNS